MSIWNPRYPQLSDWPMTQPASSHYPNKNSVSNNIQDYTIDQDRVNKQQQKRRILRSILLKCCSSLSPLLYGLLLGILTVGLILAIIIALWLTSNTSETLTTTAMMTTTETTTTTATTTTETTTTTTTTTTETTTTTGTTTTTTTTTTKTTTTTTTTKTTTTTGTTTTTATTTTETTTTTGTTTTTATTTVTKTTTTTTITITTTETTTTTTTAPICTASPNTWFEASSSMPPQCSNYTINTDATRNMGFYNSSLNSFCDNSSPFGNQPVWFRFLPPAGTMVANYSGVNGYCGTTAPGYYAGQYPSVVYTTATSIVCYTIGTNLCWECNLMSVTNCNSYFVFGLPKSYTCYARYCTI